MSRSVLKPQVQDRQVQGKNTVKIDEVKGIGSINSLERLRKGRLFKAHEWKENALVY